MQRLRKWYFTISLDGSHSLRDQIQAAVLSARKNTDLEPVCICQGLVPEMREFLVSQGVEIHEMHVPFVKRMDLALAGHEGFSPAMANGTYLKLYLPLFETRDPLILYTDVDVVFQKHPSLPPWEIRYLGACPEAQIDNYNYFNCGVMVYNVENMRRLLPDIMEFIEMRLRNRIFCAYEQGDLNGFLWMRWTHLGIGMNWKPYWGVNDDAEIIHFHGPKIADYRNYRRGAPEAVDHNLVHFIRNDPTLYEHYLSKFAEFFPEPASSLEATAD